MSTLLMYFKLINIHATLQPNAIKIHEIHEIHIVKVF